MSGYMKVWNQKAANDFDLFNEAIATINHPDFKDMHTGRRVEAVQILSGVAIRDNSAGLSEVFAKPAVSMLIGLISDHDERVRLNVVHALGALGWQYEAEAEDIMSALACLNDDPNTEIRRSVAHYIGVTGNRYSQYSDRALDLLDILKHDDNVIVRREAADRVGLIGSEIGHQAERAIEILQDMKPDFDSALNSGLDMRIARIRAAIDRGHEPPEPPQGPGLG